MANNKNKQNSPAPKAKSAPSATKSDNSKPVSEKKNPASKKIIIAAVAVLLVAAVAVTCIVNRDSIAGLLGIQTDTTTVNPNITTVPAFDGDENPIDVTTIDGFDKVPVDMQELLISAGNNISNEFKNIIVGAYRDSADASRKYGKAYSIGSTEISVPEAVMYYYDEYCTSYAATYQQFGSDPDVIAKSSMMDLYTRPEKQEKSEGVRWSQVLFDNSVDRAEASYILFAEALAAGCSLSARKAFEVYNSYSRVINYAETDKCTPDEMCEKTYTTGLTYNLFAFREIRDAYAEIYREYEKENFVAAVDTDAALAEYEIQSKHYDCVDVRLHPIIKKEGVSLAELNGTLSRTIQSEADFIEFAAKDYENVMADYDADGETDFVMRNYAFFTEYYGDAIAEWCFAPERKTGDVAVVEGPIYYCLLLCNKPAYQTFSAQTYHCFFSFNANYSAPQNQAEYDNAKKLAQDVYDSWVEAGAKLDEFSTMAQIYSSSTVSDENGFVEQYSLGTRTVAIDNWIFEDGRKEGDHTLIETETGFEIVCFVKINSDDPDWFRAYCSEYFDVKFVEDYENLLAQEKYKTQIHSGALSNIVSAARNAVDSYISIMSQRFEEQK